MQVRLNKTLVKFTATNPIFNEFLNTFTVIPILRYFTGNSNYIHIYHKKIQLNPSNISYFADGLKLANIPICRYVLTAQTSTQVMLSWQLLICMIIDSIQGTPSELH